MGLCNTYSLLKSRLEELGEGVTLIDCPEFATTGMLESLRRALPETPEGPLYVCAVGFEGIFIGFSCNFNVLSMNFGGFSMISMIFAHIFNVLQGVFKGFSSHLRGFLGLFGGVSLSFLGYGDIIFRPRVLRQLSEAPGCLVVAVDAAAPGRQSKGPWEVEQVSCAACPRVVRRIGKRRNVLESQLLGEFAGLLKLSSEGRRQLEETLGRLFQEDASCTGQAAEERREM